jgi:L-threonylcarbamoyladenylate synthase
MKILPVTDEAIREAIETLKKGGVVAHATETCYGLACDMTNKKAVKKLFAIKKRSEDQPVSGLFASVNHAKDFVVWNDEAEKLAEESLPGPLTLVLSIKKDGPYPLHPTPAGGKTIGVRVSPLPVAMMLVANFGRPLTTTSANLHGQPNPYSAEDIMAQFEGQKTQPDLILDSGKLAQNPPSRVIDLTGEVKKTLR